MYLKTKAQIQQIRCRKAPQRGALTVYQNMNIPDFAKQNQSNPNLSLQRVLRGRTCKINVKIT
jgi:hypothetical protein